MPFLDEAREGQGKTLDMCGAVFRSLHLYTNNCFFKGKYDYCKSMG